MSETMGSGGVTAAAQRYARALLPVSQERNEVAVTRQSLDALAAAIASHDQLQQVLADPRLKDGRESVVLALAEKAKAPASVLALIRTLIDADRIAELPVVARAYGMFADAASGRERGLVRSAAALGDAEKQAIEGAVKKATGKSVSFEYQVDAGLLGGVVVQVSDLIWDGSVKTQLEQMRIALKGA